uniref:F-box domain-containing protein n=1 Tax=Glossina austeni TaxID=7395 RepID=A0A1A9VXZ1_GLOAU
MPLPLLLKTNFNPNQKQLIRTGAKVEGICEMDKSHDQFRILFYSQHATVQTNGRLLNTNSKVKFDRLTYSFTFAYNLNFPKKEQADPMEGLITLGMKILVRLVAETPPLANDMNIMNTLLGARCNHITTKPCLPTEIWLKIFSNLSHKDLLHVSVVCKDWHQLTRDPVLRRKSKLILTKRNLKVICQLMNYHHFKFEAVEVTSKKSKLSRVELASLLTIFSHLGSGVVNLRLCEASHLSVLSNFMPKLNRLDLFDMCSHKDETKHIVDFNKFPNLESLRLPMHWVIDEVQSQLLSSFTAMAGHPLKFLIINIDRSFDACLNALETHASSLIGLTLSLSDINWTLQQQLKEIFKKFTRLRFLEINKMDMEDIKIILESLPNVNLNALRIWPVGCDHGLTEIIRRKWSGSLQCLELPAVLVTDLSVKELNLMSGNLHRLSLFAHGLTAQDLLYGIAPKTNETLLQLELFDVRSILTGKSLCALVRRLPKLIMLKLHGANITNKEMGYVFRHLPNLRHLLMPPCVSENDVDSSIVDISNLKDLQTLHSCLCPLQLIQNLNFKFNELSRLYLKACNQSTNVSARTIADLGSIT